MSRTSLFAILALAGALCASPAFAQSEVVTITDPGSDYRNFSGGFGPITVGFRFSAADDFTVNALGYYDPFGSLLTAGHQVGLFLVNGDGTETQVAGATVSPTDAILPDSFRYAFIAPTTLSAGTYDVAGFTNGTAGGAQTGDAFFLANVPGKTVQSGFAFLGGRVNFAPTFAAPDTGGEPDSYFGANLLTSPAPEPSGLLALCLGGAGVLAGCLRRRAAR